MIVKLNKSQLFFLLFVLSVGLHKTNYLIDVEYGLNIQRSIGFSLLYFPFIFLLFSMYYSTKSKPSLGVRGYWAITILIYSHVLFLYGLLRNNDIIFTFYEYWMALVIFISYKIGIDENIWDLFRNKLYYVYIVFSYCVYLGIPVVREHLEAEAYAKAHDDPTSRLAYEMSPILDIWPILFVLGLYSKEKYRKILSLIPLVIYFSFQLYFVKRAPSARVMFLLFIVLFMYQLNSQNVARRIRVMLLLVVIIIVAIFTIPESLMAKLYSDDTSRQEEGLTMLEQLNWGEHVIGRGLGGGFIVSDAYITDYYGTDGQSYKTTTHIAALYPYLKGGMVFLILIALKIATTLITAFRAFSKLSIYQYAGLSFLLVYILFRFIEGPPTTGTVFDGVQFGMSLGILDSIKATPGQPFVLRSVKMSETEYHPVSLGRGTESYKIFNDTV